MGGVWGGSVGVNRETCHTCHNPYGEDMSDQSKAERRAEIKRWLFNVEDENGDTHYLAEDEFIGTYDEACKLAETLSDAWEDKTGGLVLRIELERRGAA